MRMTVPIVSALLTVATPLVASAADDAPFPKEGSYTSMTAGSSSAKALPLGKERVQFSWEFLGVQTAVAGASLTDKASVRCLGSLRTLNGDVESSTNSCVITRPDGDQIFWVETQASGRTGSDTKGTASIVGGTGKMTGITGGGEWTRRVVGRAAEGTMQTMQTSKVTYRLP
jgi:hypothetical protein